MLPVTIPLIQNLGVEIQRAKNLHKARSVVYLVVAVSNIFVSIPCIKMWGAKGAAIGTAISLFAGNGIFMNFYYHKKIGIDIIYFWKQIGKFAPAVAAAALAGVFLKFLIPHTSILGLGAIIVIFCTVYIAAMWFMGMNKEEKALIAGPVRKLKTRFRP